MHREECWVNKLSPSRFMSLKRTASYSNTKWCHLFSISVLDYPCNLLQVDKELLHKKLTSRVMVTQWGGTTGTIQKLRGKVGRKGRLSLVFRMSAWLGFSDNWLIFDWTIRSFSKSHDIKPLCIRTVPDTRCKISSRCHSSPCTHSNSNPRRSF